MEKKSVSFQGEFGAFSEQAAVSFFGRRCRTVPCENFRDVFENVKRRRTAFGIVPVENSLFGSVVQNYDLLLEYPLSVIGELKLRIRHCLMALRGTSMKEIRHVYSHPQALGQSDLFLRRLKNTAIHQFYDTAGAAKMIAEERRLDAAAVAGEQAAKHYGLRILRKGIETDHRNFTRFLVLAPKPVVPQGRAKSSIAFKTSHIPGSLVHCLSAFADQKINLLKIESRPMIGKPWEYIFYVDIDSDRRNPAFTKALRALRRAATFIKILGSYTPGEVID